MGAGIPAKISRRVAAGESKTECPAKATRPCAQQRPFAAHPAQLRQSPGRPVRLSAGRPLTRALLLEYRASIDHLSASTVNAA